MRGAAIASVPLARETGRCDALLAIIGKEMTDRRHTVKEKVCACYFIFGLESHRLVSSWLPPSAVAHAIFGMWLRLHQHVSELAGLS